MQFDEEEMNDTLVHYGILRRSGRYPWGSGGENARNKGFLDYVKEKYQQGFSDKEIADDIAGMMGHDVSVLRVRAAKSIASNQQRASNMAMAERLKAKGNSTTAIARRMGVPEPTVRGWLAPGAKDRASILDNTVKMLESEMKTKPWLDVGKGVEHNNPIGVSRTRFDTALAVMQEKGYEVHVVPMPFASGHEIQTKVLSMPGTTQHDAFMNRHSIQQIQSFSEDAGRNWTKLQPPLELDPKRVGVVFKEDGGGKADGMIYVRPGVNDVSIGDSNYAQVRVAVGPDHYLKGMALYKSDLPEGVDVEFHTSKSRTDNKLDVMKKNADEPGYLAIGEHPLMKSIDHQIITDGKVSSVMNIVNEEGNWGDWSRSLSSQMLSKQKPSLAKAQLAKTYENRKKEFEEINSLTNPTVRKKLLNEFAKSVDSAAVNLKAAGMPHMGVHVILPLSSIKPSEIYAPKFKNGQSVVLIRHPHGGPFEIPKLTVNNKNAEGKRLLGNDPKDAVGIHTSVASWLSGADFDGDTVLVIPDDQGKILTKRPLDELKNFDPRSEYPGYEGMKAMKNTQAEMGAISNLITDMSLRKAPNDELARAVKHSMVVIDAEKHGLNYKQSALDNGILQLKKKYQTGGASTLISRAGAKDRNVLDFKPRSMGKGGPINQKTGALEFEPTNKMRSVSKIVDGKRVYTGEKVLKTVKVKKLALTNDAHTLTSNPATPMELLYADHSNNLKGLANRARLAEFKTPNPKRSPSAAKVYKPQVDSLKSKLIIAQKNAPLERAAQAIADTRARARISANPSMDDDTKKKIVRQSLAQARISTGAAKQDIKITDAEWEAIQAGAISHSKLNEILNHADMDIVRQHATPKEVVLMTSSKTARAKQMLKSGATRADVARALGVSLTTLDNATKGG
jgi:hypothetical protein